MSCNFHQWLGVSLFWFFKLEGGNSQRRERCNGRRDVIDALSCTDRTNDSSTGLFGWFIIILLTIHDSCLAYLFDFRRLFLLLVVCPALVDSLDRPNRERSWQPATNWRNYKKIFKSSKRPNRSFNRNVWVDPRQASCYVRYTGLYHQLLRV